MPICGFFSLFKRFDPQTIHLSGLGDFTSEITGYWSGKIAFRPLQRDLDLSIYSPNAPPGIESIDFFRKIENQWTELWSTMRETLFEQVDDFADGTTSVQLFDSLVVEELTFWSLGVDNEKWEITCTTPLDDHIFGIEMHGWQEQGFRMDG